MSVLDTHALVWWVSEPRRLSSNARRAIDQATGNGTLAASAASVLEIATLVRRGRLVLNTSVDRWLADVERLPELKIVPVTAAIAARAGSFTNEEMPGDPADRLIVATALHLQRGLVSADENLRRLPWASTIW